MAGFLNRLRKSSGDATAEKSEDHSEDTKSAEGQTDTPAAKFGPPIFHSEASQIVDFIGNIQDLHRLAELAAHHNAGTPLSIGLVGDAGSGKSSAVNQIIDQVQRLADAAAQTPPGPFLSRIAIARVQADPDTPPALCLATAIHEAFHAGQNGEPPFAAWAEEAAYASGDLQQAVRETSDRLTELRRRQDADKQTLGEIEGRRARLAETILSDAGSRIDDYARANRASIESRLAGFGFGGDDPLVTYKNLVRDYADSNGAFRSIRLFLRSLWAYRGQLRLIILAILFAGLGWAAEQITDLQTNWLANLSNTPSLAPIATWITQNGELVNILKNAAFVAAAGALLINITRAIRFMSPIRHGAKLLAQDIATRRKELDNLVAEHSQRLEEGSKEVAGQAEKLAQIERRTDTPTHISASSGLSSPFRSNSDDINQRAINYIQAIAQSMSEPGGALAPQRLLVALDGIERLNPESRLDYLQKINGYLKENQFVWLFATHPDTLQTDASRAALGEPALDQNTIGRIADVIYRLGDYGKEALGNLVKNMLHRPEDKPAATPDASRSALDEPMRPGEEELLAALADLAGHTPRQVKRFVNAYKLARPDVALFAPLAIAMAVRSGGTDAEVKELDEQVASPTGDNNQVQIAAFSSRLSAAFRAATSAQLSPMDVDALREANMIAARYFPR